MNKYRLLFSAMLSFFFNIALSQSDWNTVVETYNGCEYIVKNTELTYAITNKKYDLAKEATCDIEFDGETEAEFEARRVSVCECIYEEADAIFDFGNIPVSIDDLNKLTMVCYFDSTTKDYVGAYFIFDAEVKDYFTLEKINQLEEKLLEANINAGTTNLLNPNEKYFIISVTMSIGY